VTISGVKPGAPAPVKEDPAKAAGKQLEAFFLRQLLSEARPQSADGGFAGDTFKQMFDEAVADKMASAGGIGLADVFSKQLAKQAGTPAPEMSAPHTSVATMQQGPSIDGLPRLVMPVIGRASSGYGARFDPIQHKEIKHPGFDLAAPTGTTVDAAAAGTVTHAGPAGTYGNLITIKHANGVETRYAHLSATSVKEGDHVEAGQPIGAVGTTGYSTGPHLHFEVRRDGQPIDPAPLLPLRPQAPPAGTLNTLPQRPKT
jgi:murein DD-endopeptidase MepM/ murein hydrolase activator NlpD